MRCHSLQLKSHIISNGCYKRSCRYHKKSQYRLVDLSQTENDRSLTDIALVKANSMVHLHLSRCLSGPLGATDDLATNSLHSSRLSTFLMAAPSVMSVYSGMLSSHLFFCLPRLLPPCTVPKILLCARTISVCVYCGQEVFVGPNGWPSSVSHLFVGDMVSVGEAEEFP